MTATHWACLSGCFTVGIGDKTAADHTSATGHTTVTTQRADVAERLAGEVE
jgi:hypothetical protein